MTPSNPPRLSLARQKDLLMAGMGLLVIVIDQLTKQWILEYFKTCGGRQPIPVLGPILELQLLCNTGVAFSLLEGDGIKFLLIGIAIVAIGYLYWRSRETGSLLLKVSFGLVLGGALGNLIDRLHYGFVVDFIHFQIPRIGFSFAVFNIADSAISVGVVILAYLLWRSGPHEVGQRTGDAAPGEQPSPGDILPGGAGRSVPRIRRKL
jgi:signal peptidase II